jgi:hypothetical protein
VRRAKFQLQLRRPKGAPHISDIFPNIVLWYGRRF